MMEFDLWIRGVILGFSIAAPVGPVGLLVVRRTISEGLLMGVLSGLGAATADALYGAIAGFGLAAVAGLLVEQQLWLRLGGGLFLCYLGIKTFKDVPRESDRGILGRSYLRAYLSTCFLTLANPVTILAFVAIFSGIGLGSQPANGAALALVGGVWVGSVTWWLLLSGAITLLNLRLTSRTQRVLNWLSGTLLLGFGLLALLAI